MNQVFAQSACAMIRASRVESMLHEVCGILVDIGNYPLVVTTLCDNEAGAAQSRSYWAGCNEETCNVIRLFWAETEPVSITPADTASIYHLQTIPTQLQSMSTLGDIATTNVQVRLSLPLYYMNQAMGELHLYADSQERFCLTDIELLRELATNLAYTIHSLRTRSANEKAEYELAKYKQIVSSTPDGISMLDRDYRYVIVNDAYEVFSARQRSELVGLTVPEYLGEEVFRTYIKDHFDRCINGEVIQFQEWFEYPTLGRRFVQVTYYPYRDITGAITGVVASTRDLTDQKLIEEERENLQMQLLQSQKMELLGRLAGGIAHDFNNMLAVILMRIELLLISNRDLPPKLIDSLLEIEKAAHHSADLTRQLLGFARKQLITPVPQNLNETIPSMINMLRRLIGEEISVAWLPGAELWSVRIDPNQVTQVLTNLCVNSRDAIEGIGHILIETSNESHTESRSTSHANVLPGDYVVLSVSDTGCGMDETILAHLFEPFFTTKSVGKGTGLGLATVYGIVKQNRGYIDVQSTPDRGTTVRIHLPRYEAEPMPTHGDTPLFIQKQSKRETILLVEDEPELLALCQEILQHLGFQVLVAETPGKAIEQFKNTKETIHLVITDVVMPEMNGPELIKRLRSINPTTKWLFMSGYTSEVIFQQGASAKDHNFLAKPFSMKELASKVEDVLKRQVAIPSGD